MLIDWEESKIDCSRWQRLDALVAIPWREAAPCS